MLPPAMLFSEGVAENPDPALAGRELKPGESIPHQN